MADCDQRETQFFSTQCCNDWHNKYQPKVVVNKLSEIDIKKYLPIDGPELKSSINLIDSQKPKDNAETISSDFMRFLNLIPTDDLKHKPMERLKQSFPVRDICKVDDICVDLDTNRVIGDRNAILRANDVIVNNTTRPGPRVMKKKGVKRKANTKTIDKNGLNNEKKRRLDQNKRLLTFVSNFDFTSEMFVFLATTLNIKSLSHNEIQQMANKSTEMNRYSRNETLICLTDTELNRWKSSNIYEKTIVEELEQQYNRKYFYYSFTRRQRLERQLRLKTGIDWLSRLYLQQCLPLDVSIIRVTICDNCGERVADRWHSCRSFEKVVRKSQSLIIIDLSEDTDDYVLDTDVENQMLDPIIESSADNKPMTSPTKQPIIVIEIDPTIDALAKQLVSNAKRLRISF
ncbi:uncharacterized protein LOC128960401 [Oppia nitens]|uniref:uncharacterized protein LOC128960401 n=1 Tax=Oppia nitens TaxID=1686743 RepID=UPI0023DA3AED|nr:uncharacterized protein LOC128960401 [Oppia nitens]